MENASRVTLLIDKDISAKLVDLAGNETRVNQYLAVIIQTLHADQKALNKDIRLEHTKLISALIDKQNEYEVEIATLRKRLSQMVAAHQELLAVVQLVMKVSPEFRDDWLDEYSH